MKRFLALLALGAVFALSVYAAESYNRLRANGASTTSANNFYLVGDSADTFLVDTFYSDTLTLDPDDDYLNLAIQLAGFTSADSMNDSVVIICLTKTAYAPSPALTVYTDTFTTTLDSTEVQRHHLYRDTLIENLLWIETIVKDSFILGAGIDSSRFSINIHALTQTKTD